MPPDGAGSFLTSKDAMNAAIWHGCRDPQLMLDYLRSSGQLTERGARFFAIALCRHLWPLLTDSRSREGIEVAELCAADLVDVDALHFAANRAADAFDLIDRGDDEDAAVASEAVCCALTAPDGPAGLQDFARYFV